MSSILSFFNCPFFIIVGGISTMVIIIGFFYTAYLVIRGVLPVWYRLGLGLSRGKIAIFASDKYDSLKAMLVDSKIFRAKNIIQVNHEDLKKAEKFNVFLVHWRDCQLYIDEILAIKKT